MSAKIQLSSPPIQEVGTPYTERDGKRLKLITKIQLDGWSKAIIVAVSKHWFQTSKSFFFPVGEDAQVYAEMQRTPKQKEEDLMNLLMVAEEVNAGMAGEPKEINDLPQTVLDQISELDNEFEEDENDENNFIEDEVEEQEQTDPFALD